MSIAARFVAVLGHRTRHAFTKGQCESREETTRSKSGGARYHRSFPEELHSGEGIHLHDVHDRVRQDSDQHLRFGSWPQPPGPGPRGRSNMNYLSGNRDYAWHLQREINDAWGRRRPNPLETSRGGASREVSTRRVCRPLSLLHPTAPARRGT